MFFDELGLDWVYEPEGYHLHNGDLYLPDFYIRDIGMFVEIKGDHPNKTEIDRCMWLADGSGQAVFLAVGLPLENPGTLFCWDMTDSSGGSYEGSASIVWPSGCVAEVVSHDDSRVDRDRELFLKFFVENPVGARHQPFHLMPHPQRSMADAAKSARFEHGEKGTRK